MQENVLISVIVAAYNIDSWIGRCIDSLVAQTYRNLEIITVDDGSTDQTGVVLEEYARKDSRIVVIHQENRGLVETRETGILKANGEYVAFVDGDDTVCPDMYERLLKNALEHNADISHCSYACCYDDGRRIAKASNEIFVFGHDDGLKQLLRGKIYQTALWDKLYKRRIVYNSCFDKSIINNEDLVRNYTLFDRAQKSVYQDFVGYEYWHRENSISNAGKNVNRAKHILKARVAIYDMVPDEVKNEAATLLLNACINTGNGLACCKDEESKRLSAHCRVLLLKHKSEVGLLSRKYQVVAKLIMYVPLLHKVLYIAYSKLKRK